MPARLIAAAASGALLWASFPPLEQGWLAHIALVPLLAALRGTTGRIGALAGLVTGAVFFGGLIYWISTAGYLAWSLLVLSQSAFLAAFGALGARVAGSRAGRVLGWPVLWAGLEMLRARWPLGGFAWGALGTTQAGGGPFLPAARLGGVWLVGALLVAVNALAADAAGSRTTRERLLPALAAGVLLLGSSPFPLATAGERTFDVAAVQGNVPREHFTAIGRRGGRVGPEDLVIIENHVEVTMRLAASSGPPPDLVIWPENAFDRDPRASGFLERMRGLVDALGAPFMVGAILDEGERFANSNVLMEPGEPALITQRYDKVHLVPFGEYVPWGWARRVVPVLDAEVPSDGIAGSRQVVFDVGGTGVGSLICFESTYPSLGRGLVRGGAEVIVVSTNNAAFGDSPAAAQHLQQSRMRAIELDRTVVHAAIAGISAIVEPDGTVVHRAGLFEPALLRATVAPSRSRTPYARYGEAVEWAMGAGAIAYTVLALRRRREGA